MPTNEGCIKLVAVPPPPPQDEAAGTINPEPPDTTTAEGLALAQATTVGKLVVASVTDSAPPVAPTVFANVAVPLPPLPTRVRLACVGMEKVVDPSPAP
jgi:hypothetical protein